MSWGVYRRYFRRPPFLQNGLQTLTRGSVSTILLESGDFSLTGQALAVQFVSVLGGGDFILTGQVLAVAVNVQLANGSFALTGGDLDRSISLHLDSGDFSLLGYELTYTIGYFNWPEEGATDVSWVEPVSSLSSWAGQAPPDSTWVEEDEVT